MKVIYQNGELTNTDLKTVNEINRATFQNVFTQETEHNIPNFYIDIWRTSNWRYCGRCKLDLGVTKNYSWK